MKTSIRSTRFTIGMVLFLVIILLLSIISDFYLNQLSKKTSAILKENHYSVVFARDMSKNLTTTNQEITGCVLTKNNPDTLIINKELRSFESSLQLELNNITETGEENLARSIEMDFHKYRDSVIAFTGLPNSVSTLFYIQKKFDKLYQQLNLLSEMNAKAIELKTSEARLYAKKVSIRMSFIGALCFLIAYGFTFSFTSYFNERFYQLYNGIKEMVASNYKQKLDFKGKDEVYEISSIFNEMAAKLAGNELQNTLTSQKGLENKYYSSDIHELKDMLIRLRNIEEQALELIFKLENKKQ
jgi:two-component system, NtrC family, sensor histidine kinase KinB